MFIIFLCVFGIFSIPNSLKYTSAYLNNAKNIAPAQEISVKVDLTPNSNKAPEVNVTAPVTVDNSNPVPNNLSSTQVVSEDWYRNLLPPEEQEIYDMLEKGLRDFAEKISINRNISEDNLSKCMKYVCYDNPEIFWVNSSFKYSTMLVSNTINEIIPSYIYSKEDATNKTNIITSAVETIYNDAPKTSQYDTAKYFYKWICDNTLYSYEKDNHQEVDAVFIDKQAACAGYARTFQLLCKRAGIVCGFVTGEAGSSTQEYQAHAWNFAVINGITCYIDATWGDLDKEGSSPDYMWYCLDIATMNITHKPTDVALLPKESSDNLSRWNLQQTKCSTFNPDEINTKLLAAVAANHKTTTFKFDTQQDMDAAADYMIDSKTVTMIALQNREKFPEMREKSLYSVRRMPEMSALTVTWNSATAIDF